MKMSMEQLCYENPNSCYTCKNAEFNKCNNIVCGPKVINTLFEETEELKMQEEYQEAVNIAKNCVKFEPIKLF